MFNIFKFPKYRILEQTDQYGGKRFYAQKLERNNLFDPVCIFNLGCWQNIKLWHTKHGDFAIEAWWDELDSVKTTEEAKFLIDKNIKECKVQEEREKEKQKTDKLLAAQMPKWTTKKIKYP